MDRRTHNQKLADYFSERTRFWENIYDPQNSESEYYHELLSKRKAAVIGFVDECASGRSLRILDAGCGTGVIARELGGRGHHIQGIDVSHEMIQTAQSTARRSAVDRVDFQVGSIEQIEYGDESFDLCLCVGVLQYLQDDRIALSELSRVTRRNGHIILTLPNIARVGAFLDPYSYLVRLPLFLSKRLSQQDRNYSELGPVEISMNTSFRDRRYYSGQLRSLFHQNRLIIRRSLAVGIGRILFWQRPIFPWKFLLSVGAHFESLANKGGLSFLKAFADRWVILLQKV